MKIKLKLGILICTFVLCFGTMAFGIYAALNGSLNMNGTLGFNMHNAMVDVSGTISPLASAGSTSGEYIPVTKEIKRAAMGGEEETVSNFDVGDLYFYAQDDMVFDLSFKNLGQMPINMTITIDLLNNADKISIVEDTEYIEFSDNVYQNFISANDTKQFKFALKLNDPHTQLNKQAFAINFLFTKVQGVTLTNGAYEGIKYTLDNTTPITTTNASKPSFLSSEATSLSADTIYTASVSGYDSATIANYPNVKIQPFITDGTNLYMVKNIQDSALASCNKITSVKIPDSITSIGASAFSNCRSFTGTLTIPNSVTSIGEYAFNGCSGLTGSLTIPNGVTSIGASAFWSCRGLTGTLTIPNSVTSIASTAFRGCNLTNIVVSEGNRRYDSRNNCNAIIEKASNTLIAGCKNSTIPDGVTSIGKYAFSDCKGLTSITIPNSVTSIGASAFSDCSGLTSVTFTGTSAPTFGTNVFYRSSSDFTNLTIYVPAGCGDAYEAKITPSGAAAKVVEQS